MVGGSLLAAILLVWHESRVAEPIIPLELFGNRTVVGQLISRTGVWKRYVVAGSALLTVGMTLMGTVRYDTGWFELPNAKLGTRTGVEQLADEPDQDRLADVSALDEPPRRSARG